MHTFSATGQRSYHLQNLISEIPFGFVICCFLLQVVFATDTVLWKTLLMMLKFLVLGFLKNLCHFVCKVSGSYIKFKRVKLYESYLLCTYLYMQLNSDRQSRLPEYFGMCQHDIFGMCHLHFPRSSKVRPLCMTREHRRTVRKSRLDLPQVLEHLLLRERGWLFCRLSTFSLHRCRPSAQ